MPNTFLKIQDIEVHAIKVLIFHIKQVHTITFDKR